ncbi:uncharacterized protein TM35_000261020 [Trypanosoma theileri]|uniref:Uncharacterized protein n=1 Tax=Trypanosoma theileri TaxID=67003 RepID=A0A1X0NRC0_9TRYP|nr:uncharacterized protein TM35_000261020 [Trypanosoma theileri]ORC86650.1 hypothetical protein TM35_000261020 [Trypanosoma theileri]
MRAAQSSSAMVSLLRPEFPQAPWWTSFRTLRRSLGSFGTVWRTLPPSPFRCHWCALAREFDLIPGVSATTVAETECVTPSRISAAVTMGLLGISASSAPWTITALDACRAAPVRTRGSATTE